MNEAEALDIIRNIQQDIELLKDKVKNLNIEIYELKSIPQGKREVYYE